MLPDPWSIFTSRTLLCLALCCLSGFACLAVSYQRAKRWNLAWKEEWERRHRTSLTTLRQRLRHTTILVTVILWIMAGAFIASAVFAWWIRGRMEGSDRERVLVFTALPTLVLLLTAAFCFLGVRLTRYKLERIDALLDLHAPLPRKG